MRATGMIVFPCAAMGSPKTVFTCALLTILSWMESRYFCRSINLSDAKRGTASPCPLEFTDLLWPLAARHRAYVELAVSRGDLEGRGWRCAFLHIGEVHLRAVARRRTNREVQFLVDPGCGHYAVLL